jgi:2-oxoglutarate dehydrogenase E1 component
MQFALDFRMQFGRDVFIDLGYKYGHNEGDEPRFTQPLLYKLMLNIKTQEIYAEKLLSEE